MSRTDVNLATSAATIQRYGYSGPGDTSTLTFNTNYNIAETVVALPGGVLYTKRTSGSLWSYPNIHGYIAATAGSIGSKNGATTIYNPFGGSVTGGLPTNLTGDMDKGRLGQHQRRYEHAVGLLTIIQMGARPYKPRPRPLPLSRPRGRWRR